MWRNSAPWTAVKIQKPWRYLDLVQHPDQLLDGLKVGNRIVHNKTWVDNISGRCTPVTVAFGYPTSLSLGTCWLLLRQVEEILEGLQTLLAHLPPARDLHAKRLPRNICPKVIWLSHQGECFVKPWRLPSFSKHGMFLDGQMQTNYFLGLG